MYTVTAPLLKIGKPENQQPWLDYMQQYNLNADAIPELIMMLSDDLIYHSGEKSAKGWALIHAWRALGQLKAVAAIDPILAQLNKWEDNDYAIEEVSVVLAMIGETIIEPAFAFFMDFANEEFARVMTMDALASLAQNQPETRAVILPLFGRYLKQPDADAFYINELMIMHLAELEAVEYWDDIKALILNDMTDASQYDLQDAEMEFGMREERDAPREAAKPVFTIENPDSDATDDVLEFFFDKYGHDDSILGVTELDGFFAAIASAPEAILPSTWLPNMWGGERQMPDWENQQEISDFHNHLMHAYNFVIEELMRGEYSARMYDENGDIMLVDEWCEGYLRGVALYGTLSAEDQAYVNQHTQRMKLFVTTEAVDELLALDTDQLREQALLIEPDVKEMYEHFFQRQLMRSHTPFVNDQPQVGRNDPCPCGSGKKYKKCCLH